MQSHTVVAGDTLWALAQRFYGSGNLYPVIAAANAIPNPDHIEVGQVLSIPDTPLTDVSGTRSYIVVAGDTLSAIAQKFYGNARLFAVIAAFNKIPDPDHINVGRVLIIPAVSTVYVVAPGDTLFAIAQRFYGDGLKFGVIATFNGIGNPNLIFPGQVLAIPGVAAPTRPRSPVSALRRAVDAAEIEFDRFDALVNTSPPLAAKFGAARATAKQRLDDARSALAQAITAEPAIWADAPLVPALLVPVRMEVRYRPNEQQPDAEPALAIRVVPDDIAVHSFEAELTDAEHAAAQQYWTTVSVAGVTDRDIAAGWTTILGQLGAARAAWAVEAMHPQTGAGGVLEFPDVGRRASTWTRAATSLLLPDRFVFRGWRRGKLVFEVTGADIPSDLAIGPDPTDLSQPGQHPLGWSAASAWMVDFDEALRVGMGALVPLTGTDVGFDEIVVVGVSDRRPDTASTDLARSLQGHLYTRGLAFLPRCLAHQQHHGHPLRVEQRAGDAHTRGGRCGGRRRGRHAVAAGGGAFAGIRTRSDRTGSDSRAARSAGRAGRHRYRGRCRDTPRARDDRIAVPGGRKTHGLADRPRLHTPIWSTWSGPQVRCPPSGLADSPTGCYR